MIAQALPIARVAAACLRFPVQNDDAMVQPCRRRAPSAPCLHHQSSSCIHMKCKKERERELHSSDVSFFFSEL
jgi:hypothetical protein